jgi:hypothetical protein
MKIQSSMGTWGGKKSGIAAGALVLLACAVVIPRTTTRPVSAARQNSNAAIARHEILASYGKLPLVFEKNLGQTAPQVKYLAHANGYTLFLTGKEAVLRLDAKETDDAAPARNVARRADRSPQNHRVAVVSIGLDQSLDPTQVEGLEAQAGHSNYLIGRDPSRWQKNVPRYGRVKYRGVYHGIDAVYYGNQDRLETDYIVAPGSDPNQIALNVKGAKSLKLNSQGDMVLASAAGELILHRPNVYQEIDGARHEIAVSYIERGKNLIGIRLGTYDSRQPLVVDPVLDYSTYLGGTGGEFLYGIAVDSGGNAYVTGYTNATDFPTTPGSYLPTYPSGATTDAFVTKMNPTGTAEVYSTFLGGSLSGSGDGIAVDSSGNAFVTGTTTSSDFPITAGAYQSFAPNGGVFFSELDPTGSLLLYSTFLAGNGSDNAVALALDANENAYILGRTTSTNFPNVNAYQTSNNTNLTNPDAGTAFLSRFDLTQSPPILRYSTYLGGTDAEFPTSVAVDANANVYFTGSTESADFPVTPNAYLSALNNQYGDAFIAHIDTTQAGGSSLIYATYFGGSSNGFGTAFDTGGGIAVAANSVAVVVGYTYATDFPLTSNALVRTSDAPNAKAFLSRLDTSLTSSPQSALLYSSYWGGSTTDLAFAATTDSAGNIYMAGATADTDFYVTLGAPMSTYPGRESAFLTEFDPTGAIVLFSTYWGGGVGAGNAAYGVAVDSASPPNAYFTGITNSNFPTTAGAFQTTFMATNESSDGFVAKMSPGAAASVFASPTTLNFGNQGVNTPSSAQEVTLTNNTGSALSNIAITFAGANPTDFAQSNTCGATITTNGSLAAYTACTINVIFTPSITGAESATMDVVDSDASSPQQVALTGTGTAVSVTPSSLSFGNQTQSTASAAQTVTLTNLGTSSLTGIAITVTGANASDFGTTNTCGTSPAILIAGADCTISVTFTPTTQAAESATLNIADSDPSSPQTVPLTGTGIKPLSGVSVSPTSLSFGNQSENTASVSQPVTLANGGTVSLTGITLSFTGTNAADFTETDTCGGPSGSLTAGKSCVINVTFKPTTQAAESANLNIADSDASSPQIVPLTGTGTAPVTAFTVTLAPSSATINAGDTTTVVATVTSENAFNSAVGFNYSGTPGDTSFTASPSPVTPPANGSMTSTITIVTDLKSSGLYPPFSFPFGSHHPLWMWPFAGLLLVVFGTWAVRGRGAKRLACGFAMILLIGLVSCTGTPTTPKGTYHIQISGVSGSQKFPATFTLTVK